jgi:hemerythrin-like domain-containing protein
MKRHTSLIPLSHDHQHGLAEALRLGRAAESGTENAFATELAGFLQFCRRELEMHFADEEQALLPLLARYPAAFSAMIGRLVIEHSQLRQLIRDLERTHAEGTPDACRTAAAATATLLTDHIRWEERELFEQVQIEVGDALQELDLVPRNASSHHTLLDLRNPQATDGIAGAETNVTPIDLTPGELRDAWTADREVVLVVVHGDVTVGIDGDSDRLMAPSCIVIPANTERHLRAGPRGVLALSIHRARGPLLP